MQCSPIRTAPPRLSRDEVLRYITDTTCGTRSPDHAAATVLVLSEEHKVHLSFLTQVDVEGTCGIQWLHAAMVISSGVGVASRLALNFLPPPLALSPLSVLQL